MTPNEKELAERLGKKMAQDYAKGDFTFTQIYYMRQVALDIMSERKDEPTA